MPAKQSNNINHLLNFTLPPRQQRPPTNVPRRSRKTGTTQGVWNKERFVNAQYRFVMNPTGDYTVHFADPDIFFQWQDILQVLIPRSSALASAGELSAQQEGYTTCPICLSPPTAPRMTKCGHVFCFPCILHYLSTSENKWARCPICFDSVNARQLKAVKWYEGPETHAKDVQSTSSSGDSAFEPLLRTGSTLSMRLVQRPQITTLALPRSHTWPSDVLPPHQAPFHFLPDVFEFAKFMLATPSYLISDLTKELDDLDAERRILNGMKDTLGVMFIDAADSKVREQIAKAAALETPTLKEAIEKAKQTQQDLEQKLAYHAERVIVQQNTSVLEDVPHEFLALRSGGQSTPHVDQTSPTTDGNARYHSQSRNQPRQRRNVNPPPPSTSAYYYYQAASGLPIFLYPLDIRILLSHFHSYSSFPDEISVKVEAFAEGTVNDDLRKRCKYLSHIPEGADVVFVEADLEGVVGTDTLKNFEGPLRMRHNRRKEKSKKDDRAKARAEERERANWTSPIPTSHSTTSYANYDLPTEDFSALGDVSASHEQMTSPSTSSASPPQNVTGAWGARSFASALHAPSSGRPSPGLRSARSAAEIEEDWDVDVVWNELEQRSGNRKKRGTRLVVLGSGGGGARRR
ncbi:hypothetical protein CVT24_008892 [Panaeolus cyanescens]|uniref:RING-type domain-containing protein n=1 Tax=Panaeolus cyanescens TaxID=181874 RepID=A0A409VCT2_9AGAR|nr:hypothetical protein CVT24_008892 [Panaeolus cyanescens]